MSEIRCPIAYDSDMVSEIVPDFGQHVRDMQSDNTNFRT